MVGPVERQVPAIRLFLALPGPEDVDAHDKRGHDGGESDSVRPKVALARMSKIAEDRTGSVRSSHLIPMAPGDRITIKYTRLLPGDSFVSFYSNEKAKPEPADMWTYIGRFFTGDPNLTPPGGYIWRPTRDAQGRADPLRPRPHAWWLRFECFGSGLVRDRAFGPTTLEIRPYSSKVFEIRPGKEYLYHFYRTLDDPYLDTEVRILFDYDASQRR